MSLVPNMLTCALTARSEQAARKCRVWPTIQLVMNPP